MKDGTKSSKIIANILKNKSIYMFFLNNIYFKKLGLIFRIYISIDGMHMIIWFYYENYNNYCIIIINIKL